MFARHVSFRLKSTGMSSDFTYTFQTEVFPLLRQQKGFKDEIILYNPGSLERITISLWESKADADAYAATAYPQILKSIGRMIDGTPKVQTFDAATSTFHDETAGK